MPTSFDMHNCLGWMVLEKINNTIYYVSDKEITHLLEKLPVLSTTEESCGEIFSNNTEAIKRARNTIINESIDLLAITNNCQEFKGRRGYVTETISSVEEDFPLAYSILMYKDPEQVKRSEEQVQACIWPLSLSLSLSLYIYIYIYIYICVCVYAHTNLITKDTL